MRLTMGSMRSSGAATDCRCSRWRQPAIGRVAVVFQATADLLDVLASRGTSGDFAPPPTWRLLRSRSQPRSSAAATDCRCSRWRQPAIGRAAVVVQITAVPKLLRRAELAPVRHLAAPMRSVRRAASAAPGQPAVTTSLQLERLQPSAAEPLTSPPVLLLHPATPRSAPGSFPACAANPRAGYGPGGRPVHRPGRWSGRRS
ncbi:hypothetical protein D3C77_18630 [compost metagenome]